MPRRPYHHGDLKNALIAAGIDILARKGIGGLSLRQVARQAGVSHAAPYAHFADKQALLAAIVTEGFRKLHERVLAAVERHPEHPHRRLFEAAWTYVRFALDQPELFQIALSGVLENEKDYPEYVEISRRSFALVVQIVEACQAASVLRPGPPELMAVSVWSLVHGIVSLLRDGRIPHSVLDRTPVRAMLIFSLNQITRVPLEEGTAHDGDPGPQ